MTPCILDQTIQVRWIIQSTPDHTRSLFDFIYVTTSPTTALYLKKSRSKFRYPNPSCHIGSSISPHQFSKARCIHIPTIETFVIHGRGGSHCEGGPGKSIDSEMHLGGKDQRLLRSGSEFPSQTHHS
jgi:hypothetical protein